MNKRKHRRAKFNRTVQLSSVDGKSSEIKAIDLSMTGIGLFSHVPRVKGELLRLKFDLIVHGKPQEISVAGEVKHIQLDDNGYNFGVRFL